MTRKLVTDRGTTIEIGRELGRGGEGSVHEVPSQPNVVAKLYSAENQPDTLKQAKLRFMVLTASQQLLSYTAWPQRTLHTKANGPVVGFLMAKVNGCVPIHLFYNPADRKKHSPDAAWDFLLFIARNTAAAFAAIHSHGHVVADVNQTNILVSPDSRVFLIDTDSFQINANGTIHLCRVGVPEFTPPELGGSGAFDHVRRTPNHDNFGLAVLIFHLLFGGRHPFSGVALREDVGINLREDIQAFRFADAPDWQRRGKRRPDKSIPMSIVPERIQNLFIQAFTEHGVRYGRPTATRWVEELDRLRNNLRLCPANSAHVYSAHLSRCPWCDLQRAGVIYFLVRARVTVATRTSFNLEGVWNAIESVLPPPAIDIPDVTAIAVQPTPVPKSVQQNERNEVFLSLIVLCVISLLAAVIPGHGPLWLAGAVWTLIAVWRLGEKKRRAEFDKRQLALLAAKEEFDLVVDRIFREANPEIFEKKKNELRQLRDEYERLPELEKEEIGKLYSRAEALQKQRFLEQQLLDSADIPGVGRTKKAALKASGIKTAADVTWDKVISVNGFGPFLTAAVLGWRHACERRFVFNPNQAVSEANLEPVRNAIASRKGAIEQTLSQGAADLKRLSQELTDRANSLRPLLAAASRKLAQAEADLREASLRR